MNIYFCHPVEDAVQVVRCKDCVHFENAHVNAKGFLICPNTGMDIWEECYCAHGERFCDRHKCQSQKMSAKDRK